VSVFCLGGFAGTYLSRMTVHNLKLFLLTHETETIISLKKSKFVYIVFVSNSIILGQKP